MEQDDTVTAVLHATPNTPCEEAHVELQVEFCLSLPIV